MAVAYDARTTVDSQSGTTLGGTHTPVGTPTLALMCIDLDDDATVVTGSPTYAATAMTLVSGPISLAGEATTYVYKLENPSSGAQAFSVTVNKSNIDRQVTLVTFTGSLSSGATRTAASATGSSTAPSVAATTVSGDYVFDFLAHTGNDTTRTAGAGQTKLWEEFFSDGDISAAASTETATGVSTTMSWTLGASRNWNIIAVPIIPVVLESAVVDVTSASTIAVAATEVTSETVIVDITSASTVAVSAAISIPPACDIGPPFDTAIFGSGSPPTLYVALLSYPFGTARAEVELSGGGYARVAVPNTSAYWQTRGGAIHNAATLTYPDVVSTWGTAVAFAVFTDVTSFDCEQLIAHGVLGKSRPIEVADMQVTFAPWAIIIATDRATATLTTTQLAEDTWSGYEGRALDTQWGVCQTCGFTVPYRELRYNRRYGWQCRTSSSYGAGCWDGTIQRDEIIFVPPPDEGARTTITPTGRITTDSAIDFDEDA